MAKPPISQNGVIDALASRNTTVFKTLGKSGAIYAFSDTLKVVPRDTAETLIRRGDNVPCGDSEQTFVLGAKWVPA